MNWLAASTANDVIKCVPTVSMAWELVPAIWVQLDIHLQSVFDSFLFFYFVLWSIYVFIFLQQIHDWNGFTPIPTKGGLGFELKSEWVLVDVKYELAILKGWWTRPSCSAWIPSVTHVTGALLLVNLIGQSQTSFHY